MSNKFEIYILAILIIFASYCALSIGSSWDQEFVMTRGEERLKYIFSLGSYGSSTMWERHTEDFIPGFFADMLLGTGYVIYIMTLALWAFWFSQAGKKGKNRFGAQPRK